MMQRFTPWGIGFFDAEYGGLPTGRTAMLTGRSGSGKTTAIVQFILQGLQSGESALVLTAKNPDEFKRSALPFGSGMDSFLARGQLRLVGPDAAPSEGTAETAAARVEKLLAQISASGASHIAVDTLLPWVCPPPTENTESFLINIAPRIEKSGATVLLALPSPASPASRLLRRTIERGTPVSVTLTREGQNGRRFWEVCKYESHAIGQTVEFAVQPGMGIVRMASANPETSPQHPSPAAAQTAHGISEILLPSRRFPMPGLGESAG